MIAAPPSKATSITIIGVAQVAAMALWFSASAVIPALVAEFHLSGFAQAALFLDERRYDECAALLDVLRSSAARAGYVYRQVPLEAALACFAEAPTPPTLIAYS